MGKKSNKDLSICLKTLQGITKDEWISMCGVEGHKVEDVPDPAPLPKTDEDVRQARMKFFSKI
jgi:hypothetical protein